MGDIINLDRKKVEDDSLFVTRKNPLTNSGPYQDGIILDAALSTKEREYDGEVVLCNKDRIERLLNPHTVTYPDAPYQQRLLFMWRMIDEVMHDWGRDDVFEIDGSMTDCLSGEILVEETTPHIHIRYLGGTGWELYADTQEPNNILIFKDPWEYKHLKEAVEKHERGEDIFGEQGLELLVETYWKVPMIGVKKLIVFDFDKKQTFYRGGTNTVEGHPYSSKPYFETDWKGELIKPDLKLLEKG